MWVGWIYIWSALVWSLLSFVHRHVTGLFQYSAAELLRLCFHLSEPLQALHLHSEISHLPRRRYIRCGSRRCFHFNNFNSKTIQPIWSSSRHRLHNTGQVVDHNVLARSTYTIVKCDNTSVIFSLLNIRSLSSRGHLSTPFKKIQLPQGLFASVNLVALATEEFL